MPKQKSRQAYCLPGRHQQSEPILAQFELSVKDISPAIPPSTFDILAQLC
jgi:hypothetical protein